MMLEREEAVILANRVLDEADDPDSDLAILARQLLRAREMQAKSQAEVTRLQSLVDEAAGVLENWLVVGNDMAARRSIRTRAASFLTRLRAQPNITPDKDT